MTASTPSPNPAGSKPARILIADDQQDVIDAIRLVLEPQDWEVLEARSPAQVLNQLDSHRVDGVLLDLNYHRDTTTGKEGLDLLGQMLSRDPCLPVVVMTAWGSVELAVAAMQAGAADFIEKPWDNERLLSVLTTQMALRESRRRGDRLAEENRVLRAEGESDVIAESAVMAEVLRLVAQVAPSDASVLVTGDNGTGKTHLAREIHRRSRVAGEAFIAVNMGAIPEHLFESEMFGHVAGAFTDARQPRIGRFELADGGTLFLDEIANIPLAQQAKLLRVLESGEFEPVGSSRSQTVSVRIISATNADMATLIEAGEFRKDLYYRLNTLEIHLPPLRERKADIAPLARAALARLGAKYRREDLVLGPEAMASLEAAPWPGNVRELHHIVERAVLMCEGEEIQPRHLSLEPAPAIPPVDDLTLDEAEKHLLARALDRYDRDITQVARALGLSRSACYRRIEKHGL